MNADNINVTEMEPDEKEEAERIADPTADGGGGDA